MAHTMTGQFGTRVLSHVVEEVKVELEHAQTLHHNMAERIVRERHLSLKTAIHSTVQVGSTTFLPSGFVRVISHRIFKQFDTK